LALQLFMSVFINFHTFVGFFYVPMLLMSKIFIPIWSEKAHCMISMFLNKLIFPYCLPWRLFHKNLGKYVFCCLNEFMSLKGPVASWYCSGIFFPW
jgi:hypothetical protein